MHPWTEYWRRDEFWTDSELFAVNAEILMRRAAPVLALRPDDDVLDIGCGAGHLERLLAPRVASVHGVDVSAASVRRCEERCGDLSNVTFSQISGRPGDLGGRGGPYSLFLCVSVVQYLGTMDEIEALVAAARGVARPGARMLIGDLPRRTGRIGALADAARTLIDASREGYARAVLGAAVSRFVAPSAYRELSGRVPPLTFSERDVDELARRLGPGVRVLRGSLSVVAHRPSLLVEL